MRLTCSYCPAQRVNFTRRLERNLDGHQAGRITFGELDASVQGWINHVRYADTWGCASTSSPATPSGRQPGEHRQRQKIPACGSGGSLPRTPPESE